MTRLPRIAVALTLAVGMTAIAGTAAAAGGPQCRYTASQYADAIRHFESEVIRARALVAQNPLHESDLAYAAAVLADARACHRSLLPIATASR